MRIELKKPNGVIQKEKIEVFEEKNNIKIPEQYKYFLLQNNGGEISNKTAFSNEYIYKFIDCTNEEMIITVWKFLSIDEICIFDETWEPEFEEKPEFKRDDLWIIGKCNNGRPNPLLISFNGSDYGKIFYYEFGMELEDALSLVADNFDKFLNSFEEIPED